MRVIRRLITGAETLALFGMAEAISGPRKTGEVLVGLDVAATCLGLPTQKPLGQREVYP